MGLTWSNGFVTVGIGWRGGIGHYPPSYCCGGFHGGGFRPHPQPLRTNAGGIDIGNSVGNNRPSGGPQANPNINNNRANSNVYSRAENKARVSDRSATQNVTKQARPSTGRENNVYTDKNGNVGQLNGDQWQSRDQGSWQSDQARQNFDRNEGDRAHQSRQSGASREMSRGGGGRRR
jgi:hypothetical protein